MKVRIITGIVGLFVMTIVLRFFTTIVFNIAIMLLAAIGVWELFKATGIIKNKLMTAAGMILPICIPFVPHTKIEDFLTLIVMPYIGLMFVILLKTHDISTVEHLAMTVLFSLVVPVAFSTSIYMREVHGWSGGIFYMLLGLGGAWLSDTGAYFSGYFFGKHKLAPIISPKKTVEGAIGGIITCILGTLLFAHVFAWYWTNTLGLSPQINYGYVFVLSTVASVAGIIGDLSASVIKRAHNVKDYGNLMPGHGGVMDRFDSVLFTMPLVYMLSLNTPIIQF